MSDLLASSPDLYLAPLHTKPSSTISLRLGRAVLFCGYPFRFYAYSPETLASSIFDNGSV